MIPIRPIGQCFAMDDDGCLQNDCSLNNIAPPWSEVVAAATQVYQEQVGERLYSVHVRGSVARGTAVHGVSDVDCVAFLSGDAPLPGKKALRPSERALRERYSFVDSVELDVVHHDRFMVDDSFVSLRLLIKVSSASVFGADVSEELPKVSLADCRGWTIRRLEESMKRVRGRLCYRITDDAVRQMCRWIMKVIVRSGFDLVMEREGVYARDLHPCCERFARNYPEMKSAMWRALDLAVNPTIDQKEMLDVMNVVGEWLLAKSRILDRERGDTT